MYKRQVPFLFQDKIFEQHEGMAMGSNLAPTFANFAIDTLPNEQQPLFYIRYVDDIFAIFSQITHVDSFFNFINSIDKNLQFTTEFPSSSDLPFLDTNILLTNNSFSITSYVKPSNTGLAIKWLLLKPKNSKSI